MKTLAILASLALLLIAIVITADKGIPRDSNERIMVSLMYLAPIFSLIAIYKCKPATEKKDNLISLYFKRRVLEEKQRIDELSKDD